MTTEEAVPSSPPPINNPYQHTLNLWTAACREAMSKQQEVKKEEPMEKMMGGWKFEGKEKPVSPKICTKCQWVRRNEQQPEEVDKENWCEACVEGDPGPGHEPEGYKPPVVSASQDAATLNQSFFG